MNNPLMRFGSFAALAVLLSLTGCSSDVDSTADSASSLPASAPQSRAISLTTTNKAVILSLTAVAENSSTKLNYTYAEKLGSDDGRGITFGIIGFTSGTKDGNVLLHHLKELDPTNKLVSYIPAFDKIDKLPHPDGKTNNTSGLSNFIKDFKAHGADAKVKIAQMDELNLLYWNPTLAQGSAIGCKLPITYGELYDACVNHGSEGDNTDKGLPQLIALANKAAGGTPAQGIDEKKWLTAFLDARYAYMKGDPEWKDALDRITMYRTILKSGNTSLTPPLKVKCYGDSFTVTGSGVL